MMTTFRSVPMEEAVSKTRSTIALPATLCKTFGNLDFMRVPLPAASTTDAMCAMLFSFWFPYRFDINFLSSFINVMEGKQGFVMIN